MVPAPPVTPKFLLVELIVQAPPVSADPHPLVTDRLKASAAITRLGAVTVTSWLTVSVAPLSSVTVSFTV